MFERFAFEYVGFGELDALQQRTSVCERHRGDRMILRCVDDADVFPVPVQMERAIVRRLAERSREPAVAGAQAGAGSHLLVGVGLIEGLGVGANDLPVEKMAERYVGVFVAGAAIQLEPALIGDRPELVRPGPHDAAFAAPADSGELMPFDAVVGVQSRGYGGGGGPRGP